jgi:hypothetical protein
VEAAVIGSRWRLFLIMVLLLILIFSGPSLLSVLVALVMPIALPALLLFGIVYRLKKRWRRW